MKIIKFLSKCILAASPLLLIVGFTLLCPFCYMDEEYPSWRYTKDVVSGKIYADEDFDTLILGDSGAMSSLEPNLLSDSCLNLSVGGGTPIESYYFLKEYLEHHKAPKNVVMMYAPFHYFNIDNYETRCMYFKAIDIENLRALYTVGKNCGADNLYNSDTFVNELSCRLGLPNKYLPAITAARFVGRRSDNIESYARLLEEKGYGTFGTLDGCDAESYECSYKTFDYTADSYVLLIYMQMMNALLGDNDIQGVLLQPALNEATYNGMYDEYKYGYLEYIAMAVPVLSNMKVETELRCYDNEYFGDVSHLNRKGAEKFSIEIKEKYPEIFGAD